MPSSQIHLVTGGAGFVGSHLIDNLLSRNVGRVILLDNFNDYYSPVIKQRNVQLLEEKYPNKILDGSLIIVRGNINDEELVSMIFTQYKISHVTHLAALAGVRSSSSQTRNYMETNYNGTQILLDLSAKHKVQQFVFASTSSVYGQTEKIPFVESDNCDRPLSPYASTKRAAEILAHVYFNMHGLNITVLRLFNVYGPRGRPDMMPFKLMRACIDPNFVVDVFDDGEIKRDWTFIDDVVEAFVNALEKPLGYEIINVGCGNPIKLSTFIEHIEFLSRRTISKRSMFSHKTEPSITYCDNSRAKTLLNFHPKTSVFDGLKKTWCWFQEEYGMESNPEQESVE